MEKNALGIYMNVLPTEEIFAACARAKISCLEISILGEEIASLLPESESIRAMAKKYGVCLWSMHLPFGREMKNFCAPDADERKRTLAMQIENLKIAHALGIGRVVIHGGIPLPQTEREKYFAIAKENIRVLQEEASPLGITVCVETLMPSCIGRSSEEMLEILSAHPDLRVCLDANHLLGENHADLIRRLGNRIVTTHISDYDFIDERHWLPGEGRIEWPLIMETLAKVGYEGPILYEVNPWKTPETIERRPLQLSDYRENYEALMRGEIPKPIGKPIESICKEKSFASFYLQTYGLPYEEKPALG